MDQAAFDALSDKVEELRVTNAKLYLLVTELRSLSLLASMRLTEAMIDTTLGHAKLDPAEKTKEIQHLFKDFDTLANEISDLIWKAP